MAGERDRRREPLSIRANMMWNSCGSIINLACTWLMTVVVLRLSRGFDAAGQFSYIMSVYATFVSVVDFRIYVFQISDLHNERTLGEYFALRCITSAIGLTLVMGYSFVVSDSSLWLSIFFYALYKIAGTLLDSFHALEQINHRMDYMGISYGLQGVVSLGLFVVVFGTTQNLTITMAAMLLGVVAIGVFYDLPHALLFSEFVPGISWRRARDMLLECLPAVVALMAISASISVPRQCLMALSGEAALGIYGTVAAPVAIVQTGATYIYNPLLSYFSEAFDRGDGKRFSFLMAITLGAILGIGVLCAVAVNLLGPFAYRLVYGEEIVQYLYLLVPMVFAALAIAFLGFMNNLVVAVRMSSTTFWGALAALAISLSTMAPLIRVCGLNGVSFCNLISSMVAVLLMYGLMGRKLRARFNGTR